MKLLFRTLLGTCLALSTLPVGALHTSLPCVSAPSKQPISVYFESQSLGTNSNGCTIHIYINATVELNAQGQVTSIEVFNSGVFENCPTVLYARASFSATFNQSRVTGVSLVQSTGRQDLDAIIQDPAAISKIVDDFNDAIDAVR